MANIDLIQKRAILCAGHGGGDPGAIGQGTTEAAEVIDIVNRTVDILRSDGQIEVIHVPNELGFQSGINWVNARYGNIDNGIAVEVHKNSTNNAHGVEVWYAEDADSKLIAQRILDKLVSVLVGRGVKGDSTNRWGRLGWCRDVNTWAPLVEMGFVSDGGDPVGPVANQKYAEALAKGILNVFGLSLKPVVVAQPPAPKPVTWAYKVLSTTDGKQLGVYNVKKNAWAKYQSVQGAAKIVDPSGKDLTPAFSLEFNPPRPVEQPYAPKEDVEKLQAQVNSLQAIVDTIVEFLSSLFSKFKK